MKKMEEFRDDTDADNDTAENKIETETDYWIRLLSDSQLRRLLNFEER